MANIKVSGRIIISKVDSWKPGDTITANQIVFTSDDWVDWPSGDAQSFDILTGKVQSGGISVAIIDRIDSGTNRIVTQELTDQFARQQLLGKRGFFQVSTNGGTTYRTPMAGYVTSIRLVDAVTYEIQIGDTLRVDKGFKPFQDISNRLQPYNRGTCLLGGPVKRGFNNASVDNGPVKVYCTKLNGIATTSYLYGQYTASATFVVARQSLDNKKWLNGRSPIEVNQFLKDYIRASKPDLGTGDSGSYSEWVFEVIKDNVASRYVPSGAYADGLWDFGIGAGTTFDDARGPRFLRSRTINLGTGGWDAILDTYEFTVLWPHTGSSAWTSQSFWLPTSGSSRTYDMYVWNKNISDDWPLHIEDHPADILGSLWAYGGITYSTSSINTMKARYPDMWMALRIKESDQSLEDFQSKTILGPLGWSYRSNASGSRELFESRILVSQSADHTLTINDLASNSEDGSDSGIVYSISEQSAVSKVVVQMEQFYDWSDFKGETETNDGIVKSTFRRTITNPYAGPFNNKEITYTIPGTIALRQRGSNSNDATDPFGRLLEPLDFDGFADSIAEEVFSRYGWGAVMTELNLVSEFTGSLGDEVLFTLPHFPNATVGQSPTSQRGGSRIGQVVEVYKNPVDSRIVLLDSGQSAQPSVTPTIKTAGTSNGDAYRYFDIYITNRDTIVNQGMTLKFEIAAGTLQPSGGIPLVHFNASNMPYTASSYKRSPNTKYWVRARTESGSFNVRPSDWSSWVTWSLPAVPPPTIVSYSIETGSVKLYVSSSVQWGYVECYAVTGSQPLSSGSRVGLVPAVSNRITFPAYPSTIYTASIRQLDSINYNPASIFSSRSFTTSGSTSQLPTPSKPVGFTTVHRGGIA